jgi:AbrB family looped-hinge helix DNA binding protein
VSKVTSKYQVSVPKALADRLGVRPGDELGWEIVGRELRATPGLPLKTTVEERLRSFDDATRRLARRKRSHSDDKGSDRGWTRDELYARGRTR